MSETYASGNESWHRVKVGEPCHEKAISYGQWLRQILRAAHRRDRIAERIYEGSSLRGLQTAVEQLRNVGVPPARLNVAKSVIDTVVARLGKRRAMPSFDIVDADWSLKLKAKKYRKWLLGKMSDTEFDRLSPLALRAGCIARAGFTSIAAVDDDVVAEEMYSDELLIDPREAQYGRPWQAMRVRRVARDWLLDQYGEDESTTAAIKMAPMSQRNEWDTLDAGESMGRMVDLSGYVDVYEAWRLPSGDCDADDADDHAGRHAICIQGATLLCEAWLRPRFPFAVYRYDAPVRGWWGRGLIDGLADLQERINAIVRDIQQNLEVGGKLIVFEQEAMASPVEMLTGSRPFRYKYRGSKPPEFHAPNAVSGSQVEMLQFFIKQAYDLPGTSQAMATSRSSLGLNASGVALDTQYDIESERLSAQEANYANYRLDAARCYIDAARDIARAKEREKGRKRSSVAMSHYSVGGKMERLDFVDVALEDDDYKLRLEPVNFIPDTRAGKLAAVQELSKAGIIPAWMAGALFDEPDMARANKVLFAAFHNLERIMECLAEPDEDMGELMPETFHDLAMAKIMGRAYYNVHQAEGAPDEVLERFRTWIQAVLDLQAEQKKQEASEMAPVGPDVGGPMPVTPMGPPGMPAQPPGVPPVPGMPPQGMAA
ncbi:MAG: hypothetical protein KBD62_32235 [Kofleriaceae bacterium]|nr:hypothetical protein [Kofleriaceae bacterium]